MKIKNTQKENKLQSRMIVLVNRSLSPIQKGIQAGHAILEYSIKFPSNEYFKWITEDKTIIILDGGTSNATPIKYNVDYDDLFHRNFEDDKPIEWRGDMENHVQWFKNNYHNFAEFREPDLNDCLTAIAFIVDEKVYDYEKYPDFDSNIPFQYNESTTEKDILEMNKYIMWLNSIGGETNLKLREFLKQFKKAK